MFIDTASVVVKAGDGGNGAVSFRHEKFIDRGGPDGGDGGNGGSVIFVASRNQNTLASFRYQKELKAEPGGNGGKRKMHGRNGADLRVAVPVGTAVMSLDGELLADLTEDGQEAVVAKGGKGGFGNAHFVSSRRQAPRVAEKGELGELLEGILELKMIADIGLVGQPNAGKSTLLSVISNAEPEIANYPFTTLKPNLGMAPIDDTSLLVADIPGLIEGAAEGKGLGDEFLRHVERTAVLLHLVDGYQEDVAAAYRVIQSELKAYKLDLTDKPQIVALTKIEGLDADIIKAQLAALKKAAPKGTPVLALSAHTHEGVAELLRACRLLVDQERERRAEEIAEAAASLPVISLDSRDLAWQVERQDDKTYLVTGSKIERFAARTDFDSEEGIRRLRDIMKKMGIMHVLVRKGVQPDDRVIIADKGEFTY